jgi:nicotinate-nucleotide adenylyltransferase
VGHLVCAQEAHAQLGLEFVELMPTGQAPHREIAGDPGPDVRAQLCDRAAANDDRLRVGRLEIERPGPSYTADTLRLIHERHPGDELFVILGADQAARLKSWHEPEAVLELATVAVAARGGVDREQVAADCAGLAGAERMVFFDMPRLDISSSEIRARAASGRAIRYLVPDTVANLIAAESLYSAPTAVTAE